MPGIEFVGAETGGDADDDVLDTGPRRPVPRWVWVVAGLVAVAVAIAAVVASRSGDGAPTASGTTSPFPSVGPGPTSIAPPAAQISALTSDGTSLYWIAGQRLYRAGPVGRVTDSVAISPTGGEFADLQLVADASTRTIWVVARGASDVNNGAGDVEGFDTADLSRKSRASARSLISGGAVLGGALYVLAAGRLLRILPGGSGFTAVASVDLHAHGLVADPTSLLFVEGSNGSAFARWTPSGGVQRPAVLDATNGTLAVIGATIFFIGTRGGRGVVDTLTPAGRVVRRGVPTGLTGDLEPVATGGRVLLILGQGPSGLRFACLTSNRQVDAPTPDVQAVAPAVSANVAVLQGEVFEAVGSTVRPVDFGDNVCG